MFIGQRPHRKLDAHSVIKSIISQVCFIVFLFIFAGKLLVLKSLFPRAYTWTELLINYEGGFIRRGLLGEIVYKLSWVVTPDVFFIAVIGCCYLFIIKWMLDLACKFNFVVLLFVAFSPTLILFPIYAPEAFGRKDVFVLIMLLATTKYSLSLLPSQASRRRIHVGALLFLIMATIVQFIHEVELLFLPIQLCIWRAVLIEKGRMYAVNIWVSVIFIVVFIGSLIFFFVPQARDCSVAICKSWNLVYPQIDFTSLLKHKLAFYYLDMSRERLLQLGTETFISFPTNLLYLGGLLLSLVPVFYFLRKYYGKISVVLKGYDYKEYVLNCLSLVAPLFLFILVPDYGRWIYLMSVHWLVFVMTLAAIGNFRLFSSMNDEDGLYNYIQYYNVNGDKSVLLAIALIVYFTTWRLLHWVEPGLNPIYFQRIL